jgi:hypothetical protein
MYNPNKQVFKVAGPAFNCYVVKRKGKIIKGETARNRNAAKRARRAA